MAKTLGMSMTTWDIVRYQGFTASPQLSWVGRVMTVVYLQGPKQKIDHLRQADVVGHFKNPLSSLLVIGSSKSKTAAGLVSSSDHAMKSYPFGSSISGTFAGGMQDLDWLMYVVFVSLSWLTHESSEYPLECYEHQRSKTQVRLLGKTRRSGCSCGSWLLLQLSSRSVSLVVLHFVLLQR